MNKIIPFQRVCASFSLIHLLPLSFAMLLLFSLCTECKADTDKTSLSPQSLADAEKTLGTDWPATAIYHALVTNPEDYMLIFDGYIFGIEKGPMERVSHYKSEPFYNAYFNNLCQFSQNRLVKAPRQEFCYDSAQRDKRDTVLQHEWDYNSLMQNLLLNHGWNKYQMGRKRHFLSHIFSYSKETDSEPVVEEEYNVYRHIIEHDKINLENGFPDAFQQGMTAIEDFGMLLKKRLQGPKKYTHIFFCSMGWHADQKKSFENFNDLITRISNHAKLVENQNKTEDNNKTFEPLVVGITWPANWKGVIGGFFTSYWNKGSDADEVGSTIAAVLLNQILRTLESEAIQNRPKVVMLSHSFGTRLTSSALFLRELALGEEGVSKNKVDLYIGLEGAVSGNRFLASKGNEGQPYRLDFFPDTTFVYTWSRYDKANPISACPIISGAKHIGGKPGYKNLVKAIKNRTDSSTLKKIGFKKLIKTEDPLAPYQYKDIEGLKWPTSERENLLYIDVSDIIDNHNDIYEDKMGAFVYDLIQKYAPY